MTISDISLLVVAAILILYRVWAGWRHGASLEMRHVVTNLFGLLFAVRFWEPCAQTLIDGVTIDPRWVTTGTFVVLYAAGTVLAGFVVRLNAPGYQSVKADPVNRILGVLAGLFSGALLGGSLLWLAAVATPDQFAAAPAGKTLAEFPQNVVRGLEESVAGVGPGSASRLRFPVVALEQVPVEGGQEGLPEGATLVQVRGQVSWH